MNNPTPLWPCWQVAALVMHTPSHHGTAHITWATSHRLMRCLNPTSFGQHLPQAQILDAKKWLECWGKCKCTFLSHCSTTVAVEQLKFATLTRSWYKKDTRYPRPNVWRRVSVLSALKMAVEPGQCKLLFLQQTMADDSGGEESDMKVEKHWAVGSEFQWYLGWGHKWRRGKYC